jgi:diguanylate cyclase (GGDEF)-like protein
MIAFTDSSITMDAPNLRLEHFRALKSEIENHDDPQQKLELSHTLVALAEHLSESERAMAAFMLGSTLHDCDQFGEALRVLELGRNLQQPAEDLARTLDAMGYVKYSQGEYPQAMTLFLEALTQAKISKEAVLEAMVYNSISMVYCGIGDVNNSLEYQLKALEMYRQCGSRHGEATALSNLAIDYGETGDFVRGLECNHAALEIAQERGFRLLEAAILREIGTQYLEIEDDRAIDYLKRASRKAHQVRSSRVMIETLHSLGRAFVHGKRSDLARRSLRWALQLALNSQRQYADIEVAYRLARVLLEQPERESDLQDALEMLQECAPKVERIGDMQLAAKTYRTLSEALEQTGQTAAALEALKTSLAWNDRQRSTEGQQRTLALTMQHAFSEANRQAELERTQRLELARVNEVLMLQAEQLERDATHDGLTGLPNRRYLERLLDHECTQAATLEAPLCVALADIDYFKQVNDRFSHAVGDEVLRVISRLFRQHLREQDTVGRYGGEEFAFILPNTTKATSVTVLERLRLEVERFDWASIHATLGVTVSIGIAETDQQQGRVALLNIADTNLYIAKRAGRNRTMS